MQQVIRSVSVRYLYVPATPQLRTFGCGEGRHPAEFRLRVGVMWQTPLKTRHLVAC